jgi:hypothetical protein
MDPGPRCGRVTSIGSDRRKSDCVRQQHAQRSATPQQAHLRAVGSKLLAKLPVEFGNVGFHRFDPAHLDAEQEAVAL